MVGELTCQHSEYEPNNEFVIRREGEEVFRAKLIDIPQDLWPDDIRAEYERYLKRTKKETN